jgi:hypothetical protein
MTKDETAELESIGFRFVGLGVWRCGRITVSRTDEQRPDGGQGIRPWRAFRSSPASWRRSGCHVEHLRASAETLHSSRRILHFGSATAAAKAAMEAWGRG